ncbi:MAG: hypothetical protein D9V46_01280 [Deltaproteobacteria bacterium]|jgi:hypothetical protein|uniref:hypothetical protein n=1 Tax=Hydrosulfovibrio ferrireducens TaxID=2934181 RepID=UPI00120ED78F|nr:MAG: hypothetical protein D9V46_01280 [Deltaproteobacteria bacterium]
MTIASSLIEEIIAIHFDPRTGSAFWLEQEKKLGLEARKEITGCESFHLFGPMDTEALRTRPLLDFIPNRFHNELPSMILAESGGTTGTPIRRVYRPDEFSAAFVDSWKRAATARDFPRGCNWLFVGPSGPHIIGQSARAMARSLGSLEPFAVDCDVRWIKRQATGSLGFTLYLDHVLDQAMNVIRTQNIEVLLITPPLLLALADRMNDAQRERIRGIHLAGMALTVADSETIRHQLFPQAVVLPGYGNSLVGVLFEHALPLPNESSTYMVDDPALWLQLIAFQEDSKPGAPDLAATLKPGQRGRVVAHRLDPSFLLLNMVERDTACYAAPTGEGDQCVVTAVEPIRPLISSKSEGVY